MKSLKGSYHMDSLRMHHFQFFAVVVVMAFVSFLITPVRRRIDPSSTFYGMLHIGSFAANFGAQLWVTFVAGLTMFYSLPRHMFGKVQSRLFPMFFLWSLVSSGITLCTFMVQNSREIWNSSHYIQVTALYICFIIPGLNSLLVGPLIVSTMVKAFKMEVDAGVGDVIGYADMKELKKNPIYASSYKTFRRCHGISAMLTVASLAANTVYLYYLTTLCLPL